MMQLRLYLLPVILGLVLAGCSSTRIRTANPVQIVEAPVIIPEDQLLDVGIGIFNPGIDALSKNDPGESQRIREAEARFMPHALRETLQHTGNWGMVRIIPNRQSKMDVWIDAEILKSDGSTLELQVTVEDSSGKRWFNKRYADDANSYSYNKSLAKRTEPFQGVYNSIANDMLAFYMQLNAEEIHTIRLITELKFAKQFSEQAFGEHLATNKQGYLYLTRLPADDDPILLRVRQIRHRDYTFVDTLQDYYDSFVRKMDEPYLEWRKAFYEEGEALREVQSQSNQRLIGGALAVLAGILAQGSSSDITRAAGAVGIGAGAGVFVSGLNKREEAKIHAEALTEISNSLDAEMEPHSIELENRTVTLTGSVSDQYRQWQQILKEIYETETGITDPAS